MSQFGYSPLRWMKHSRTLHNCISGLQKKHFGTLKQNIFVTAHHRDFQTLTYKICKIKNDLAPEILTGIDKYLPKGKQL